MTSIRNVLILGGRLLALALFALGVTVVCRTGATAAPVAVAVPAGSAVTTFSVEASATSVASGEPVSYTATVRLSRRTPSLRVRLRIYTSGGWLLYQRTQYVTPASPGVVRLQLVRPESEPAIEPGQYRVQVTAKSSDMAEPLATETRLRVYPVGAEPVPVVVCVRVTGPPMTDPQGRFVTDPLAKNPALDAAATAADLVLGDSRVRLSLAVSPVLLSDWQRVVGGYQLLGAAGVTSVATSSPAPQRYGDALARIRAAAATKRLELLSLGYADPNLSWLAREGLSADIGTQYRLGWRQTLSSLEASATSGTAAAGEGMPSSAASRVREAGIRWIVLSQRYVRIGKTQPSSGVYRSTVPGLRAMVADTAASRSLNSTDATGVAERAFVRFLQARANDDAHPAPFVVATQAGPGMATMEGVSSAVKDLVASPWARLTSTRSAFNAAGRTRVSFADVVPPARAPEGYWDEVTAADDSAAALAAALGSKAPDAISAQTDAVVAESAAWAGPDRSWALADRGRSFAAAASRRAKGILGRLRLSAPDVTLSGSAGEVPVTITNPTRRVLKVVFLALDSDHIVNAGGRRELLLRPGDTYLTLRVDLRSSLSSTLKLVLRAGGVNLDSDSVVVRASHLDRLAIIGGILLLLGGLLVFIVMRVRAAGPLQNSTQATSRSMPNDAVGGTRARYTGTGSDEHERK